MEPLNLHLDGLLSNFESEVERIRDHELEFIYRFPETNYSSFGMSNHEWARRKIFDQNDSKKKEYSIRCMKTMFFNEKEAVMVVISDTTQKWNVNDIKYQRGWRQYYWIQSPTS